MEFSLDGTVLWKHQFKDRLTKTPVIAPDGTVFIVMNTPKVAGVTNAYPCAFRTQVKGYQKNAPWPCYMANNQRTGDINSTIEVSVDEGDSVTDHSVDPPVAVVLKQNSPNPFNPETTIPFTLSAECHVRLAVYNSAGMLVAELADGRFQPGEHRVTWNAGNLSSGLYFYKITAQKTTLAGKMVLVR